MLEGVIIAFIVAGGIWLIAQQASAAIWFISLAVITGVVLKFTDPGFFLQTFLYAGLLISLIQLIRPLRSRLLSPRIMKLMRSVIPSMSATEREALEAGTVTWEGDLFTGAPDYDKLLKAPSVQLSAEEQAFIDGPVNELCRMIDDWDISHNRTDLPKEVWDFIAEKGFFGMIISKKYGGLEFSANAQKSILIRLYSCSVSVASTVSVPNSLGPAELLLKYGTQEQRDYYLPRLAKGIDIPCFALTGPNAGSDAASIPDSGIVCRQKVDGREVLGVRLNWNKRYITLAPVATVIGLAFRMFDPDNLLGKGEDIGITCALIPAETPGVVIGRRHFPLNAAFMNGPTQGKDVFVPMSAIIGGEKMAGQGWRMLMECLSAGRVISLPSSACGGAQLSALTCGAYARIRQQFNQSISQFEGIEEPLARIAGNAYIIDSGLRMGIAAVDQGQKPAVVGAILKYHTTERARGIGIDAMDIHGGKGICLGPKNYLGRGYQSAPISITVEGANILTRSLIIFGQGAIRCHPYVYAEMESIRENDVKAFDRAFWGHASFIMANFVRSIIYGFTDGRGGRVPKSTMKRQYQLLNRYSSNMAFMTDYAMAIMGSTLKRREKISARMGDILSKLYLISAVLKRFHDDGEPASDRPLVQWSCEQLFYECEEAMANIIANFPGRAARLFLRCLLLPLGRRRKLPADELGAKLAQILTQVGPARDRLTQDLFKEDIPGCAVGNLEAGFIKICAVEALEQRLMQAWKKGELQALTAMQRIEEALEKGMFTEQEAVLLREAEQLRQDIIAVDDFAGKDLQRNTAKDTSQAKAVHKEKENVDADKLLSEAVQ